MNGFGILSFVLLASAPLCAQAVMAGLKGGRAAPLFPTDAAVLEMREVKNSLPCGVTPTRTELGFDFVFQAGYAARVRLRDLVDAGNSLTAIFRVTSDSSPERPVYFEQKWSVPPLAAHAAGVAELVGAFNVGEGDYQVDWLLRDRQERVCSAFWRTSARMPIKAGAVTAGLPAGSITSAGTEPDAAHESSNGAADRRLAVSVLLNIGPGTPGATTISPAQTDALLAILRSITREPRVGSISVTAFNLEHRQVIFQEEAMRRVNFAGLKKAIGSLSLGTVSVGELADNSAEARFLVRLAAEQAARKRPDALIFVGPKSADEAAMTRDILTQLGDARCPVFYLHYAPDPSLNPWRDLIGSAVKYWRGREFSISRPVDFASAWSKIMSQLGRSNALLAPER